MAKGLFRATGRRKKGAFKRTRTRTMRSLATIPRAFPGSAYSYMPLPARMSVQLRGAITEIVDAGDGVQYGFTYMRMDIPQLNAGANTYWAGGFLSLFELYSKAVVKKVRATTRIENMNTSVNEVNLAVVPWALANTFAATASFERLKTQPFTHVRNLGSIEGSASVITDTWNLDIEKWLDQPLLSQNAVIKGPVGLQATLPSPSEQAPMPTMVFQFRLPNSVVGSRVQARISYDWHYMVDFTGLRDLPTVPGVGTVEFEFSARTD